MRNLENLTSAAEKGDSQSMFRLGVIFGNGEGVRANQHVAANWYLQAAEAGHAEACGKIGYRYTEGVGVSKDYKKAMYWFNKGVDQNDPYSAYQLALIYYEGSGVEKNPEKAKSLFEKSGSLGFIQGLFIAGLMYANGDGVAADRGKAIECLSKAAAGGHDDANQALSELAPEVAAKNGRKNRAGEGYGDDTLVNVRKADGHLVTMITVREIQEQLTQGTLDESVMVQWHARKPWSYLKDHLVDPEDVERATTTASRSGSPKDSFCQAADRGDYSMLRGLLSLHPELISGGNEALVLAVKGGHTECVRLLVSKGANLADAEVIDAAVELGDFGIQNLLNPTRDAELAEAFRKANEQARKRDEHGANAKKLRAEAAALQKQLDAIPTDKLPAGAHSPKCPTCGSGHLERITLGSKGIAALLVGVFSLGHISKTFHCKNCGYKW